MVFLICFFLKNSLKAELVTLSAILCVRGDVGLARTITDLNTKLNRVRFLALNYFNIFVV